VFFAFEQIDYRWWISLGDEIKGKTGLPNESVEIDGKNKILQINI
jgi:hypothetical protein